MKQRYQTKATKTWASILRYDKKEKTYSYCINFMYGNWREPNEVALVFDEHGEYVKTNSFVYNKFRNQTLNTTAEDHVLFAMSYKEIAEKSIKELIKPIKKENIVFDLKGTEVYEKVLRILFEIGELYYGYDIDWQNPSKNQIIIVPKEDPNTPYLPVSKIPTLKGIETFIRGHRKIRLKYVNELASYEQMKKKMEKEYKMDLDLC